MPRPDQPRRFAVQIAPSGWRGLGRVDRQLHNHVVSRLHALAEAATPDVDGTHAASGAVATTIEGYTVTYELDADVGVLRLLDVKPTNK